MAGEYDWLGALLGAGIGAYGERQGTTSTNSVSPEFQPLANAVSQRGLEFGNMPYNQYTGSLVSNFNPYQYAGMDMAAQRAMQQGGLPAQAEGALSNVLTGNTMMGQQMNPYANASTAIGSNPYAGANPYLEQNIQNTMGDMAKTYNQQVAPTMAATALRSGSFGNTGAQEMESASRDQLQRNMGRVSGDMRMQDYGMQQGLAEADINRRFQGRATDINRNANIYEQMFGRNQQGFELSQGRMMTGLGLSPSIYGLGYVPSQQLQGVGGQMQQQGQRYLDSDYQQWQQAQNWPFKTYDAMLAPFSGAAVGSSTYQQGSPLSGAIGGAMLGSQLWGGLPKPPGT